MVLNLFSQKRITCEQAPPNPEAEWLLDEIFAEDASRGETTVWSYDEDGVAAYNTACNYDVARSTLDLEKSIVTITNRFDGSEMLYDLLLSTAKENLEKSIKTAKLGYQEGGNSCYNSHGS